MKINPMKQKENENEREGRTMAEKEKRLTRREWAKIVRGTRCACGSMGDPTNTTIGIIFGRKAEYARCENPVHYGALVGPAYILPRSKQK